MRFPWPRGGDAARDEEGLTREEVWAAAEKWNRDVRAGNLAYRLRRAQRAAEGGGGRAGKGHPFWDKGMTVSSGRGPGKAGTTTITGRRILRQVLTAPDGCVAGFDGFEVKTVAGRRMCNGNSELGRAFHVRFGRKLVARDPAASYCGTFTDGHSLGVVAYAGPRSGADALRIVRRVAKAGGGRPDKGGSATFAQAGGMDESKRDEATRAALGVLVE